VHKVARFSNGSGFYFVDVHCIFGYVCARMKESISVDLAKSVTPESLQEILESSHEYLLKLVGSYYFSKRGRVHNLRIDRSSISLQHHAGSFIVLFDVNFTQGCQDLSYDENEKMKINFSFNDKRDKILFEGEEVREREPDEL